MNLRQFIEDNRAELSAAISRVLNHVPRTASCNCPRSGTDHDHPAQHLTPADIRDWVLNDESLYRWARSEGCRI